MTRPLRVFFFGLALMSALAASAAEPLRVGIDVNGDPMTLVDDEGVPTGFAVDIMNAIADEMGFKVVYSPKPWADMYEDFRAGRLDALANITYTKERAEIIDFTVPHMVMKGAVFIRKGAPPPTTPADLRARRVALKRTGSGYEYLRAHGWLDRFVEAETLRSALLAIEEGRADATLDARIIGQKVIRDSKLAQVEAADIEVPGFAQRLHIGLQRGDSARLALINEGLARLHTNGTYDRIHEKWIGPLEPQRIRLRDLQPYLLPTLLVLASIFGALVWQRQLLLRLKRQAAALHQSEERLTLVLEGSEDGFWDWDLRTGRLERSERWAAMLGYTLADIDPTFEGGQKLLHPDDRRPRASFETPVTTDKASRFDIECRMKAKSGEWRWILNRGKVVARAPDGTPLRMAGTHTDITNLKEAEEEREKLRLKMLDSQKLESLGVLAGGIAHDFNNLLTVILANATFARSENNDARSTHERLGHIETAARRAADLCHQMLAYAGRGNFVVERTDLGQLVQDTSQLLRVSISKKAKVLVTLAPDLPPVEADISQLQQVVMNLVINASDALGDKSGEISLVTRLGRPQSGPGGVIHSFDLPAGDCVCVEVRDTGQGMDPATLARVFDPFFTTKFAGRGLGLAAVLGIVRAHRGALTVESTPGVGSSFSLFLPAAPHAKPASRSPLTPQFISGRTATGTILVADDEPVVLSTTDQLLQRHGYRTVLAANGHEAVSHFRTNPHGFAAVLLDLTMPGLDGAEALRKIRAINPNVRALLMSGYSEQDVLARVQDQGPVPVLRKPFSREKLLARIAEVTAG